MVEGTLAAGFFIAAILTALTTVSGAHVNPAVSIGFLVARQCSFVRFFFYVIAQSAGSITGEYHLMSNVGPETGVRLFMGVCLVGKGWCHRVHRCMCVLGG